MNIYVCPIWIFIFDTDQAQINRVPLNKCESTHVYKKAGWRGELATYTQTEDITEGNLSIDKDDSVCWQYVRYFHAFTVYCIHEDE
jgi:hypothetical protein